MCIRDSDCTDRQLRQLFLQPGTAGRTDTVSYTHLRLGTDYIDLMLLHQPMADYINAWKGLEKLYKEGQIRAIGMANFYPHVLALSLIHICNANAFFFFRYTAHIGMMVLRRRRKALKIRCV